MLSKDHLTKIILAIFLYHYLPIRFKVFKPNGIASRNEAVSATA